MVVKLTGSDALTSAEFESSVISYGSEAYTVTEGFVFGFESSVISYGSEAAVLLSPVAVSFESSVISYGSEATEAQNGGSV